MPPPQSEQSAPKHDVKIRTVSEVRQPQSQPVTIHASNYKPYRDPTPRGKSFRGEYVGWQTPRRVGRGPVITGRKPQQTPKQNPPQQPEQPKQQQKPQQQAPVNNQPGQTPWNSYQYPDTSMIRNNVRMSPEDRDAKIINDITKHVMFFCIDNAERRDDVIYELAYITTLYHIELDPLANIPRKKITDIVRKIVDLIEDKMEGIGVQVQYEYDDDDRYENPSSYQEQPPLYDDTAFASAVPITDDEEAQLTYDERLRNSGITFGEGVVSNPKSGDHVLEEVDTIFNSNEVKSVADNIENNTADPNDTSTSDELTARISKQLNTK